MMPQRSSTPTSQPPPAKRARYDTNVHASEASTQHMASHPSSAAPSLPPLSLSIIGIEPFDEFIKEVADFVLHMINTRPDLPGSVEVEAKLGILRDRSSGQRIHLPVLVETILAPDSVDCRFETNMSVQQHKHFNSLLNTLKVNPPIPTSPVDYQHLYLTDSFYQNPDSSNDRDKIRVTRDEKTSSVRQCVRKIRLGDLNIYSPKRAADWRISVNYEVPVNHPVGSPVYTRRKDRLSYTHEEFIIDLTQVTTATSNSPPQVQHELELEIARSDFLLAVASKRNDMKYSEPERNAYDELIRAFVNNARMLVRNSGE